MSYLILGRFSSFGGLSDGNSVGRGETEAKRKLDRSSQPSRQGKERSGGFFFYYLVLCLIKLEMYNYIDPLNPHDSQRNGVADFNPYNKVVGEGRYNIHQYKEVGLVEGQRPLKLPLCDEEVDFMGSSSLFLRYRPSVGYRTFRTLARLKRRAHTKL